MLPQTLQQQGRLGNVISFLQQGKLGNVIFILGNYVSRKISGSLLVRKWGKMHFGWAISNIFHNITYYWCQLLMLIITSPNDLSAITFSWYCTTIFLFIIYHFNNLGKCILFIFKFNGSPHSFTNYVLRNSEICRLRATTVL